MSGEDLALRVRGVWKQFGDCVANAGADLEVARGEIHALVGENGAGKSTLMRLIAGLTPPDRGAIEVFGKDVTGWSTAEAITAGVGMVHQHFMLVPTLTVAENIVLGREPTRGPALDLEKARAEVEKLCGESGLAVPATALVGELPVGICQRVEILKTLYRGARLLILDEPTAVLSPNEIAELLKVLTRLRDGGTTIVLITHKLAEVMEVSSRVTVMRRGRTVTRLETKATTSAEIARSLVGRDVVLPEREGEPTREGPPLLEVRDLTVKSGRGMRAVDSVSFSLAPGEILGIAGVEGNGQTELVEALTGLSAIERGTVKLGERDVTRATPRDREAAGLAHIPEDRHRRGLVLDFTVAENLVLGRQSRFVRSGLIDERRLLAHAADRMVDFDVRPNDPRLTARALSGGNQQKVVVAREMGFGFKVLCAAQPTRGVDIGAIELIHSRLLAARREGKAILLVSAELTEILALSDRVGVMFRGKLVALMPRAEAHPDVLGPLMTGAAKEL
ncbi:MAG: ABC transporter ATP-binding protein [Polyangiaceae bacterium]